MNGLIAHYDASFIGDILVFELKDFTLTAYTGLIKGESSYPKYSY